MVATVEDGRLTKLRPDRDNPVSRGFACPKGIAFTEVHNDPDRLLHPLKRTPSGDFERVSWDAAMADITARLKAVAARHGTDAVGWYFGNPSAFSASHTLWVGMFLEMLGTPHAYSAGSQDVNNRFAASQLLYGTQVVAPVPDLERTDLLVIIGANPVVSHGSVVTAPRFKDHLLGIVDRVGRVLVIDPRRTETARAFDWLPVTPDGDAFLLLAILQTLFSEGLARTDQATGAAALAALAEPFTPEAVEPHTGIDPETVRALARDLARTERASLYGRTGTCLGRSGTLTTFLLDAVNLVAGNLDAEGGALFGDTGIPGLRTLTGVAQRVLGIGYAARHSRIGGLPTVLGQAPASVMAKEITTPGRGQLRALFVSAGNPVLSVPNGEELEAALDELDLMVSLDIYVNETNAHADYVLPATTMYEREDFPIAFQTLQTTPFRQATPRVVEPAGEAREEWTVIDELMRAMWRRSPGLMLLEAARRARVPATPRRLVDGMIRLAAGGLGRGGLSFEKLVRDHPHGVKLADHIPTGGLRKSIVHRDRKVHLDHEEIAAEVRRLGRRAPEPDFPLSLIGMRELRSENSWMHTAPLLVRGGRTHTARMHPDDAAALGLADGDGVRISSRSASIELPVTLTDDIKPGVVAIPHGWGHKGTGRWRKANAVGGVNVNQLMSTDPDDLERLAGMAHLNGVPVRAEPLGERVPAVEGERLGVGAQPA